MLHHDEWSECSVHIINNSTTLNIIIEIGLRMRISNFGTIGDCSLRDTRIEYTPRGISRWVKLRDLKRYA